MCVRPSWFHALEPGPSLATAAGATKDDDARLVQARQRGAAQLAATALPAALREQVRFIFREGDAGRLLEAHGQARCDDLIVLGTHPRHRLLNLRPNRSVRADVPLKRSATKMLCGLPNPHPLG